jgi:hypothetical protein
MLSFKSISTIASLMAIGIFSNSPIAQADGDSATIRFSGYVSPTCLVSTVDHVHPLLPVGANPHDYLLRRCNTGEPDRLIRRENRVHRQVNSRYQVTEEFITVVP